MYFAYASMMYNPAFHFCTSDLPGFYDVVEVYRALLASKPSCVMLSLIRHLPDSSLCLSDSALWGRRDTLDA